MSGTILDSRYLTKNDKKSKNRLNEASSFVVEIYLEVRCIRKNAFIIMVRILRGTSSGNKVTKGGL